MAYRVFCINARTSGGSKGFSPRSQAARNVRIVSGSKPCAWRKTMASSKSSFIPDGFMLFERQTRDAFIQLLGDDTYQYRFYTLLMTPAERIEWALASLWRAPVPSVNTLLGRIKDIKRFTVSQ
jgi:hypothetical protein